MCVEEITMYRTNDGKVHKTEVFANDHIVDKCCEILDNMIGKDTGLTRNDIFKVIQELARDIETVSKLSNSLSSWTSSKWS